MNALLDPLGFLADSIAIANALGFYTQAQQEHDNELHQALTATSDAVEVLSGMVAESTKKITNMTATACAISVRSRLKEVKEIPSDKLEVLIKLLFYIKECPSNVVLAIIVRYQIATNVATLGIAVTSSDEIEVIVSKMDRFLRSVSFVEQEKSVYVNVRIRGKYNSTTENFCSAVLARIATEVCGFSSNVKLASVMQCKLEAIGTSTTVLLEPTEYEDENTLSDQLRRVFLVGGARTGKSTLGNALTKQELFHVSRGMTGTVRIERGERVEEVGNDLWVTEIYDTPGLNDKDGLRVLYETAIEDHIRMIQRASTLIMTISVDAGITESAFKSLGSYKNLFGDSIVSMLLVVLTLNVSASTGDLQNCLNMNWPTIAGLDISIEKQNVFCVSLHDLRTNEDTASHRIVEKIASRCREMPLKLMESLRLRYKQLKKYLKERSVDVEKMVRSYIDEGWQAFDHLTDMYEQSPYVKMTGGRLARLHGFVCKRTGPARRALVYGTAGLANMIRKHAVHIQTKGVIAEKAWDSFYNEHANNKHHSNLMRLLGDHLIEKSLAVRVRDMDIIRVGTLPVKRYFLTIFHPIFFTHEKMYEYLEDVVNETGEELSPDVFNDLAKSTIPVAMRVKRKGDREKGKRKRRFSAKTLDGLTSGAV